MTQEMQQSMELSHEIVIANGHLFGIQGFTCNITLSLEQIGRTYNGVSMALPFVLLIISAIKKNSLRKDYVATGDVSLAGAVLTVDYINNKIVGAINAGLKGVVIPAENGKDVKPFLKTQIKVIEVTSIVDAWSTMIIPEMPNGDSGASNCGSLDGVRSVTRKGKTMKTMKSGLPHRNQISKESDRSRNSGSSTNDSLNDDRLLCGIIPGKQVKNNNEEHTLSQAHRGNLDDEQGSHRKRNECKQTDQKNEMTSMGECIGEVIREDYLVINSSDNCRRPLYKQPCPYPPEELPKPDPERKMSHTEYLQLSESPKLGVQKIGSKDVLLKKVILNEISKSPAIWNTYKANGIYSEVAVNVFKRTGKLLNIKLIQSIFKLAKDGLRNRLRDSITEKLHNEADTENHLWQWELYEFIRFYREITEGWELRMRALVAKKHEGQLRVRESAECSDMIKDDKNLINIDDERNMKLDHVRTDISDTSIVQTCMDSSRLPSNDEHPGAKPTLIHHTTPSLDCQPTKHESIHSDFSKEMDQLVNQATRIAREHPERAETLLKALFATVSTFDQEGYVCVEDKKFTEKQSK
ncbi:Lon proteolytic domain-containing protein [Caenorhabditis elegans]|nr:Lon proteolytic domain-containing protein [Caenorhabditis elegans]CCA65529.1 Lon proteolytic domain-containing protein [Caenorhabditis elegans]|eukprot:NP_001254207.1 LIn-8 Domain containing [Caenorhabditis elegans]